MAIQPEITTLEQLIKDTQETLQKAQQDLRNYQKLVKQGTITLGSDLEDFIFVHHAEDRTYWREFYSELAKCCTKDQPIQIKFEGTTPILKISRWAGPNEYQSEPSHTQIMGILTASIIYDLKKGHILFPVEYSITRSRRGYFGRDDIEQNTTPHNLPVSTNSFKNHGKYIHHSYVRGDSSAMPHNESMEILFGDKEEYLRYKATQQQDSSPNYDSLFTAKKQLSLEVPTL